MVFRLLWNAVRLFSFSLVVLASAAAPCLADGGFFIREQTLEDAGQTIEQVVADGGVSSNGQRALLWRDAADGCWDLFVEPGEVRVDGAVWVLPLPVAPTSVQRATAGFLGELEKVTRPVERRETVAVTQEVVDTGGGDCLFGGSSDGGGSADEQTVDERASEAPAADPAVSVLREGRLEGLDWEVLAAESGADLVRWLDENGFAVPAALEPKADAYVAEGWHFLATRISRGEGDAAAIPGLRIELCGEGAERPVWPLRLTPLSTTDRLDFLVFVADLQRWDMQQTVVGAMLEGGDVIAGREVRFPGGVNWGQEEVQPTADLDAACGWDEWSYATRLEAQLDASERVIVQEFSKVLEAGDIARRLQMDDEEAAVASLETPELRELLASSLLLTRLRGRATATGMATDLVGVSYQETRRSQFPMTGVYRLTCRISMSPKEARDLDLAGAPPAAPPARRRTAFPVVLVLVPGLALALRRLRRAAG